MAGTVSTTGKNAALDGMWTRLGLSTVYVAALIGGVEVSGNNYARAPLAVANIGAASGGVASNTAVITFPIATNDWGTVDEHRVYSAISGGTVLVTDDTITPVAVTSGKTLKIPVAGLSITLSDPA